MKIVPGTLYKHFTVDAGFLILHVNLSHMTVLSLSVSKLIKITILEFNYMINEKLWVHYE